MEFCTKGLTNPLTLNLYFQILFQKEKKNANNTNKNHDDNDDFIPLSNRGLGFVLIQDGAF